MSTASNIITFEKSLYYKDGFGSSSNGYYDDKVVPVTVKGGWDKCRGPFSHHQAKHWGIDTWKCYSKCYTRKDYNGGNQYF